MAVIVRILLGVVFLLVGMTGLVVPILPGWVFLLLAVALFFPNHAFTGWLLRTSEPHMPKAVATMRKWGIGREKGSDPRE